MFKKQKGFTILEALIMAGITGGLSYGAITLIQDSVEKEMATSFIKEVSSVVKAVDHRIAVDGYDATRWNTTNWTSTNEVINTLIRRELVSSTECNNSGNWTPRMPEDAGSKPISCNHWERNDFNGMTLSANLTMDGLNFIERFDIFVGFSSEKAFKENFQNIKYGIENVSTTRNQERSGGHDFDFVSAIDGSILTTAECIRAANNCVLNMFLERDGGLEYLKLNGSNSIVNNNVSFIDTTGTNSPMLCVRWRKDNAGVWSRAVDQSCGIGIYRDLNHPVIVEVAAETGTFGSVLLNQDCNVYTASGNGVNVSGTSPCGMREDGEVIQVVESFHSNLLISDEGNFDELIVTELIANNITSTTLQVSGLTEVKELLVNGDMDVNGDITFGRDLHVSTDVNLSSNLTVSGTIDASDISGTFITAPIGNFDNINSQIRDLQLKANDIRTDFNSLSAGDSDVPDPGLITTPDDIVDIEITRKELGPWSPWTVIPNTLQCSEPLPKANTIEYGVKFIQSMNCSEDYERQRIEFNVWEDEVKTINRIIKDYKTENFVVQQQATGTDVTPVVVRTERELSDWSRVSKFNCKIATTTEQAKSCRYDGVHNVTTRLDTTTNEGTPSWQAQWGGDFFKSGRASDRMFTTAIKDQYVYSVGSLKASDFRGGVQKQEFEICRAPNAGATTYTEVCDVLERRTLKITYFYSNNTTRTETSTEDRIVENKVIRSWSDSCRDPNRPDCV
jgi:Tfp pilus assembly major pilin PilA